MIYYDVYYKFVLLEAGLTSRQEADNVVDTWVESCEEGSDGADYLNYRIVMEKE